MDRVRVGVIGTSWFADLAHLPNLASHPGAELAAICGRRRERAEEIAGKYGIPAVFTDYAEMIDKARLDAVVVVTPDDLHYPMTMAALDAGLHVLCEKPLARTAAQAQAMLDKAESAGRCHMTFFTYRGLPHYRYLRELIEEGYLDQGRYLTQWGRRGTGDGEFDFGNRIGKGRNYTGSLTVDEDGYIYVADTRRIQKFEP